MLSTSGGNPAHVPRPSDQFLLRDSIEDKSRYGYTIHVPFGVHDDNPIRYVAPLLLMVENAYMYLLGISMARGSTWQNFPCREIAIYNRRPCRERRKSLSYWRGFPWIYVRGPYISLEAQAHPMSVHGGRKISVLHDVLALYMARDIRTWRTEN